MVILKKIIILTEYEGSGVSGIVKFENFAGRTSCFVRVLGIKDKAEVCIKCGEDVMYCGTLSDGAMKFGAFYDLTKPIYVAVARQGAIVCMGSNTGRFSASVLSPLLYQYYANAQTEAVRPQAKEDSRQVDNSDEEAVSVNKNNQTEQAQAHAEQEEKSKIVEIDNDSDNHSDVRIEEKAADAEEQKSQTKPTVSKETKKSAKVKIEEPFFKQIEASMQELFDKYEKDEELINLVPDSKWARVPVDDSNYYVVGLIYSDGNPNLICYGVPDKDSSNPPDNSNECRQWLELEKGGRGYWMMYQSAISGQTLTTQII